MEFSKRLDKDLPFYYHTSTHHRFFEGDRPDFSKPSDRPRALQLMAGNLGRRASLVQRGATSIRTQFHNVPVELPHPHVSDTLINYNKK